MPNTATEGEEFRAVFRAELEYIYRYRNSSNNQGAIARSAEEVEIPESEREQVAADLSALCLSGGGIRSATFNLGVLQQLAKRQLLSQFDYLSTVSGGGYIGGWFSAWSFRAGGTKHVEGALCDSLTRSFAGQEPPLKWIRQTRQYLAPTPGLSWVDNATLAATYLRNLAITWALLLPLLIGLLALPTILSESVDTPAGRWTIVGLAFVALVVIARTSPGESSGRLVAALAAPFLWSPLCYLIVTITAQLLGVPATDSMLMSGIGAVLLGHVAGWGSTAARMTTPLSRAEYQALVHVPACAGACLLSWGSIAYSYEQSASVPAFALAMSIAVMLVAGLVSVANRLAPSNEDPPLPRANESRIAAWLLLLMPGLFAALAVLLTIWGVLAGSEGFHEAGMLAEQSSGAVRSKSTFLLLPAFLVLAILLSECAYFAWTSRDYDDDTRELMVRSAAWYLIYIVVWLLWAGIGLFGPGIVANNVSGFVVLAAIVTTALVVGTWVLGRLGVLGLDATKRSQRIGTYASAIVAAALVLVVLLLSGTLANALLHRAVDFAVLAKWSLLAWAHVVAVLLLVGLLGYAIFFGTNFNRFSLHGMYRERLVRTFLGASRTRPGRAFAAPTTSLAGRLVGTSTSVPRYRKQGDPRDPHPMTGFDDNDNLDLVWLSEIPSQPLWIINTALNVETPTDHTTLPRRQTASFTFSPLFCGSESTNYRPTERFGGRDGGVTAGTAMAISGAAVNPNIGYSSSALHCFVMAILNVALGWWHGNPSKATHDSRGPTFFQWLAHGLFKRNSHDDDWINLSDGGHFDNLGLYEMLKRRCAYIVVVDASQDPKWELADLGNAIRRARIDLGANITLHRAGELEDNLREVARRGILVYDVVYANDAPPSAKSPPSGKILYVKPSMLDVDAQLPADLVQHRKDANVFPHESTMDQFFTEAQFESYRMLGFKMIEARLGLPTQSSRLSVRDLFEHAQAATLSSHSFYWPY